MIQRYLHIIFFLVFSHLLSAQVLYQISGNSARARSYLFATDQLTDIVFLDTIPNLFHAYSACDQVITEFAMQDYQAIAALRQAALLPDSIRLSNFYSVEEYLRIDESLLLGLGMGLDQLCRMKPSYLTEMYRSYLLTQWADYDPQRSSEHFFETIAEEQGKPVYGLDDIGETMYMLFDREPFNWQCSQLLSCIDNPDREVRLAKQVRDLYQQGRLLDIVYQVSGPDNTSTLSYSDYQVYAKRNKQWVKRLQPYLREGKAFICLNALYLGGDDGLIAQLRAAGYRVRPVNTRKIVK